MAICRSCKSETQRVRTTYHEDQHTGEIVAETDECPNCKPGSFAPRWLQERPAIAPEVYPKQFRKRYLQDGRVGYFSSDERRADLEAKMLEPPKDEHARLQRALEKKRAIRRTAPMSRAEVEALVAKVRTKLRLPAD